MKKKNQMARVILALGTTLMAANADAAVHFKMKLLQGGIVGNGGAVVACPGQVPLKEKIEILDYYEGRELRKMAIDTGSIPGTWKEKVAALIARVRPRSEMRYQLYSDWLEDFEARSRFLEGADFVMVPDTSHIAIPTGCKLEQAVIQKDPRFDGDVRYYIKSELWNAMDESQKAGLVMHELIYREAISYGHQDSVATRMFNGVLSSSKITALNDMDFLTLIEDLRFEMTDLPVPANNLKQFYSSERVAHTGKNEPTKKIYELDARVIAQVGKCSEGDCAKYDKMRDFGLLRYSVGNQSTALDAASISPVFKDIGDDVRLYERFEIGNVQYMPVPYQSTPDQKPAVRLYFSAQTLSDPLEAFDIEIEGNSRPSTIKKGFLFVKDRTEGLKKGTEFTACYASGTSSQKAINLKVYYARIINQELGVSVGISPAIDEEGSGYCLAEISPTLSEGGSLTSLFRVSKVYDSHPDLRMSLTQNNLKAVRTFDFLKKDYFSLNLDLAKINLKEFGGFTDYIQNSLGANGAQRFDLEYYGARNIDPINVDSAKLPRVVETDGADQVKSILYSANGSVYFAQGGEIYFMPGLIELYPDTGIPKKLVLARDVQLQKASDPRGTWTQYNAGQVIELDPNGLVLSP